MMKITQLVNPVILIMCKVCAVIYSKFESKINNPKELK